MFNMNGDHDRPLRVALYARVSSEEQRENQTIQTQIEIARKWLELQEIIDAQLILHDRYLDDGVSGTIPLAVRPAGARLMADAQAKKFTVVLVYKIDRLGRDPRDILNTAYHLDQIGVAVKSLTEEFDMSSPSGRFMFNIFAASAGFARDSQIERSVEGTRHWAKEGVWLGGIVPYGYRVEGAKKQARLVVNEDPMNTVGISEADVVRLVYRKLAEERWSCVKIAEHLNSLGIPTAYTRDGRQLASDGPEGKRKKHTAGVWRPSRIRGLVINSAYKGEHVYGKRSNKKRNLVSRAVPAVVDEQTWQGAQDALKRNRLLPPHSAKRKYLLRGLVKCSICGLNYQGTNIYKANGRHEAYLKCNGKIPFRGRLTGRCPSKIVPAEALEDAIWDDIEGFLSDPGPILERLAISLRESQDHTDATMPERDVVAAALARKRDEKDSMLDLYRRERIALPDLERQLEKIADEENQLADRLTQMDAGIDSQSAAVSQLTEARELLEALQHRMAQGFTWEQKREMVELLVNDVRVETVADGKAKKADITVTYAFDGSANNRTGMGSWRPPA